MLIIQLKHYVAVKDSAWGKKRVAHVTFTSREVDFYLGKNNSKTKKNWIKYKFTLVSVV